MYKRLLLSITLIFFTLTELNHLSATPAGAAGSSVIIIQGSGKSSVLKTMIVVGGLLVSGYFVYTHFFRDPASAQDVKRIDNRVKHLQKQVQEVDDNTQKLLSTANEMCGEISANGMEIMQTRENIQKQILQLEEKQTGEHANIESGTSAKIAELKAQLEHCIDDHAKNLEGKIQSVSNDTQHLIATTDEINSAINANKTEITRTRADLLNQFQETSREMNDGIISAYETKILKTEAKILEAQKTIMQKIEELQIKQAKGQADLKEEIGAEIAILKEKLEELNLRLQLLDNSNDQVIKRLDYLTNSQQEIVLGISGLRELLLTNAPKNSDCASSSSQANWLLALTGLFGSEGSVRTDNVMDLTVRK